MSNLLNQTSYFPYIMPTHSGSIAFDNPVTSYPQKTVTGPITLAPNTVGATAGYGAIMRLVADGVNVPDLTAFKAIGAGAYDNTADKVNQLVFFYDGTDYCIGINQLGTVSTGGGGVGDTTAPTVVSATAIDATTIRIVFSEIVTTSGVTGFSFKQNGSALAASAVSGTGTTTLDFTVAAMAAGDTILRSYNSATGNTLDAAGNELVSFTDQAVTNSIPAATPVPVAYATRNNVTPSGTDSNYLTSSASSANALSALSLEAGVEGYEEFTVNLVSGVTGVIGLSTTNAAPAAFADINHAVFVYGGAMGTSLAGAQTGVDADMANGFKLRLRRYLSTGVWKVDYMVYRTDTSTWYTRRTEDDASNGGVLYLTAFFFGSGEKLDAITGLNVA